MLSLKKICKTYSSKDIEVNALNNINLQFRNSEFVSILGKSGSGKTTLLNIIGGLDDYTSGDLIINGRSTKEYNDNDWDVYRNHKVGFVFQSYNLIPHQTALANVELALTISGIDKNKRKKIAIEALKKVGLEDQINKLPHQMSGGQIQRIAIARALVNNPDIVLADEPTGALDTKTSKQIMDILKEVAEDRLVIMVTHNPELAEKYSTRIIKLSDGKITDDSNPYNDETKIINTKKSKSKKNFMSFKTALGLSINNLLTKKGRTILTSFAGAIGIIGIALVLSISNGVQNYIKSVEEDTLSTYPILIEQSSIDTTSLLSSFTNNTDDEDIEEGVIKVNNIIGNMVTLMTQKIDYNDLEEFKKYVEDNQNTINKYINAIQYSYNIDLQIYKNASEVTKLNPINIFSSFSSSSNSTLSNYGSNTFVELLDNDNLLKDQYEILTGKLPENYDEVVLIVDKNNKISDYTAYHLGLKDTSELDFLMQRIAGGENIEFDDLYYTYDDLLNLSFKVVLNTDFYKKVNGHYINMENDEDYMQKIINNSLDIKIVGIVKINDSSVLSSSSNYGQIGYKKSLMEYIINKNNESEIGKEQLDNPDINVLTGTKFSTEKFDYDSLTNEQKKYISSLSTEELTNLMAQYNNTYQTNLELLGLADLNNPSSISFYPKDFNSKDKIKEFIEDYNNKVTDAGQEDKVITYNDYVGLLMNSVTTIVNVISYVLIAFVSVSLIVSSIMIGIITYISVLERTKEIGILRAIGASKKDISRVFNAETFIVGLLSGTIGIVVTLLLNIPINHLIYKLADINNIASLPIFGAIILIFISVVLTLIAGLIPSSMASKKDPVEALRSE